MQPWRVTDAAWNASLTNVDGLLRSIAPAYRNRCEQVLRGHGRPGFSQAWQDWLLYRNFFAGQLSGVYADVGTNHPLKLSNTAFFDICLGWRGACFEPQEIYHSKIREQRRCALVPRCVMGRPGNATFSGSGTHMHARATRHGGARQTSLECVGLRQELQRLNLGTAIDLLSIDIEGLEPAVLRCIPWAKIDVRIVLIETNKLRMSAVDNFFHNHGFANVATILQGPHRKDPTATWLDNVFLKMPSGPLVVPQHSMPPCTPEDREINLFCAPYAQWERGTAQWQCPA